MRGGARGTWRAEERTGPAPAPGRGAPRNCAGTPCAAARGPRMPPAAGLLRHPAAGRTASPARRVARGCPGRTHGYPWRSGGRPPDPSGRCRTARDGYGIHPHSAEPAGGVREEVRARDRSASRAGWLTRRRRPAGQAVAARWSSRPVSPAARRRRPQGVRPGFSARRARWHPLASPRHRLPTQRPDHASAAGHPRRPRGAPRRVPTDTRAGPAPATRRAARRAPRRACAHSEQFKNRDGRRPPAR